MPKATQLQLGPVQVTTGEDAIKRMAILLWGPANCGKTTFAATAPGDKLWLSFGDNEHVPISSRKDVHIANLSPLSLDELFRHAKSENPFNLDSFLSENENIETVVVDSVTALTYRALEKAVEDKVGAGKGFSPTIEAPGISAYGGRNAIVLKVLTGILRVTDKYGVHCIMTAHEDDPTMKMEGNKEVIDYISVQLGGKIVNNVTWRLSEIWFMDQSTVGARDRRLAVRPTRMRRPMKTRMFDTKKGVDFVINYDADKPDKGQMTIASWYEAWKKTGQKVPVPVNKE